MPAAITVGCLGGEGPEAERYGDWFRNANNYDTTQDLTGVDQVIIAVGADGGRACGPAATQIDVGTTVWWEWTGRGGRHNVLEENGVFESALTAKAGHTFSSTLDEPGVYRRYKTTASGLDPEAVHQYYCTPHQPGGMVGALRVTE